MMCRWCLGRVSVMCSDCVVMFWGYVGDALVLCWWCLCSVSVMLWCLSDGWWCCGDRDDIVMFRWWILMNILRFSVGSEEKRVAVRCVFAIGVVCWANSFTKRCFSRCFWLAFFWTFQEGMWGCSSCLRVLSTFYPLQCECFPIFRILLVLWGRMWGGRDLRVWVLPHKVQQLRWGGSMRGTRGRWEWEGKKMSLIDIYILYIYIYICHM